MTEGEGRPQSRLGKTQSDDSSAASLRHMDRVPAAVLFGDMKGSTAAAEQAEVETVELIRDYLSVTEMTVRAVSSQSLDLKTEGDGFMVRFPNAHAMVECGMALRNVFRGRGWKVRLGGSYVEAFEDDRFLLGADLNRAARIASAADAEGCQFLVANSVPPVVRNRVAGIEFREYGRVPARGIDGGLVVFEVVASGEASYRDRQRNDYLAAVALAHEWVDLGGLAPQVGTELLSVRLEDVFVHLSANPSAQSFDRYAREEIRLRRDLEEGDRTPHERERELRELAKRFDERHKSDLPSSKRLSVTDILRSRRVVVLGDPGAGKTTLLRYLARQVALRQRLEQRTAIIEPPSSGDELTPIYVRIADLAEYLSGREAGSIEDFISTGLGSYGVPIPHGLLELELRRERCFFLLDGIDEIGDPSRRRRVRDTIRKWIDSASGCPCIVTSRVVCEWPEH